jgi:fibronectin type 3 domain-containing protein
MTSRLLLAAALLAASGCGHSVKPTEPFRRPESLPQAVTVLATQEPGAIVLAWSITGDAYRYVDGWNVYRKDDMDAPPVRLNGAPVPDVIYRDDAVVEGGLYFYSIRSVSPAGVEGVPTHDLVVRYDRVPPAAPTGLIATPEQNAIALSWVAPSAPDLASYRLYRDGSLMTAGILSPAYTDMPVAPGAPHRYAVAAVDGNGNESARSDSVLAEALGAPDTTPPGPPLALAALAAANGIELAWSAPPDADLLGFLLYRKAAGEVDFTRLAGTGVLLATTYDERTVASGVAYAYAVSAVDSSGNEGAHSPEASATWTSRRVDTGGTSLGSVYPWCGVVSNSGRMQFLVPVEDIARAGTIDTLAMWIQSGRAIYQNVTVSLSHTNAAALGATFAENRSAATSPVTVFGPATTDLSVAAAGSPQAFPLSTSFDYDGVRNLLVEMSWSGDDNRTVVFAFRSSPSRALRLWTQPDGGATRLEPYQQFLRLVFR